METDFSQFHQVFYDESLELINAAEEILVKTDLTKVSSDDIDSIFRCAHCIKSSSGMFGFSSVTQFSHIIEDYLDKVRNQELRLTKESIDILLKSLDCLRNMIEKHKNNQVPDPEHAKQLESQFKDLIEHKCLGDALVSKEMHRTNGGFKNTEQTSIRVATEKVDALINMVGELAITQSILSQICHHFDVSKLPALQEGFSQLEQNCRELQESVMRIRMLPISNVFNRFPRMVRELSDNVGKKIELKISGENTELDKTILEKIGDPLVHLIRNAIDHGIESPEERLERGKAEIAHIDLNAFHQGGNIIIEVQDDGRGLSIDKILTKAQERSLVKPDETLTSEQIYEFIFTPGFSTADKVTDISGRGVGMDVVRQNINHLGGKVNVKSTAGKGACVTITLPLTLAIIDGQLVRVGNSVYVIPLVNMIETIHIEAKQVHRVTQEIDVYCLRNQNIPIIRLYEIFNIQDRDSQLDNNLLVIVEADKQQYGILVEELLDLQQVVIKSMSKNYGHIEGISGATILADGSISLILDTAGIIRIAANQTILDNISKGQSSQTVA